MVGKVSRRGVLSGGLAAGALASFGAAAHAVSAASPSPSSSHPFSRLIDVQTGRNFQPDARFSLVLSMTAQQLYPGCGEAFGNVDAVMEEAPDSVTTIRPIFILPKPKYQPDPEASLNLRRALGQKEPWEFTILTGDFDDITQVSDALDGAFMIDKAQEKVIGHTLDSFFLTPQDNKTLLRYDYKEFDRFNELNGEGGLARVKQLMEACQLERNQHLCL